MSPSRGPPKSPAVEPGVGREKARERRTEGPDGRAAAEQRACTCTRRGPPVPLSAGRTHAMSA